MAYPTVSAPYGLIPINLVGGRVFAGATRQIPIGSGEATAIFYGDVVKLASTGTIQKDTGETTATPVGVFLGCSYVNAQGQTIFAQYFPANTTAPTGTSITAYVADDPDQLFKVALVSGNTEDGNGLTIAFLGRTVIGTNLELVQNTGSTVTGDSKVGVYSAAGATTTATLPLRVIDVVPDTANSSGNFCEVILKWNAPNVTGQTVAGGHQYLNPTGV